MSETPAPEWKFCADQDDPLTAHRIPVACFKPSWSYLISFDRESAERPTEAEIPLLVCFLNYEREWFNPTWQAKLLARPLDVDGGANTITFHKYGPDDWAYRRWTWERGPLFVPPYNRTEHLSLAALLDRIMTPGGETYRGWVEWKAAHPEVFGSTAEGCAAPPEFSTQQDSATTTRPSR